MYRLWQWMTRYDNHCLAQCDDPSKIDDPLLPVYCCTVLGMVDDATRLADLTARVRRLRRQVADLRRGVDKLEADRKADAAECAAAKRR